MAKKAENVRDYTAGNVQKTAAEESAERAGNVQKTAAEEPAERAGNVQKTAAEEPSETAQKYAARIEVLFRRLARSKFRSRFALGEEDFVYIERKGMDTIRRHAQDFVGERLAPAYPRNDGKQTPMRGHPVFIAQHATGTCCRGCLEKWHGIPEGRPLSVQEQEYIAEVIMAWIKRQAAQQAEQSKGGASAQGEGGAAARAAQQAEQSKRAAPAQGEDCATVRAVQAKTGEKEGGASAQNEGKTAVRGAGKKARRATKKKKEKEEYVQLSLFSEE